MLELFVPADSLRLIAVDIDGTLLNPEFHISETDLATLRRVHAQGIEIILVTGRRHTFALPIAQQLGFDLWLISSNGAITRSLGGETFHRDLLPEPTCRELVGVMQEFRGQTVLTFDSNDLHGDAAGTIVLERLDKLEGSIQRWLEKNMQYIQFVAPIEKALTTDPVQAMFCGPVADMQRVLRVLGSCGLPITVLRTEYPAAIFPLSMCSMPAVPRDTPSSAGSSTGALPANRSWPLVITITILKCLHSPATLLSWGMQRKSCVAGVGRLPARTPKAA